MESGDLRCKLDKTRLSSLGFRVSSFRVSDFDLRVSALERRVSGLESIGLHFES